MSLGRVQWSGRLAAFAIVVWCAPAIGGAQTFVVRDRDRAACLVEVVREGRALQVSIAAPETPAAPALDRLPARLRQFDGLPARILLHAPAGSAAVTRLPIAIESGLHYPVIERVLSERPFVKATFPRTWVTAGVTVVAERAVRLPDGESVIAQSTCRITDADAIRWRQ